MTQVALDINEDQFKELERRITTFPDKYRRQVEAAMMTAMARETAKQAKRTTAFTDNSGNLRKTIRAARRRFKQAGRGRAQTLSVVLAGNPDRGAPYGFFIHAGFTDRGGGQVRARPFLLTALEQVQGRLLGIGRAAAVQRFAKLEAALKAKTAV